MNSENPYHPGHIKIEGYIPTALTGLNTDWIVRVQTAKAVLVEDSDGQGHWFPKTAIRAEGDKISHIRLWIYQKIKRTAARQMGN